ncbi:MAG: alpha/beta fold hydrolase [Anaerolineales bacterium]|jgi:3-oxoadipate enol-lactonase
MPQVEVNDVNLYYEFHGPERAPVLVLNNGVIMNAATSWIFQTETLAQHYRVLQYDCRGQGQSDHPDEPYSMELHADDLAALLDALGVESAHILGISYGGEVAQAFVLKYPTKTRSLILIDTVSEVGAELRLVVQSWLDALQAGDPLAFFNATVPWNFSSQFIGDNPALLEDAKRRYALLDFPAIIRLCECFLEVDFTDRLAEIEVPTCIMVGELDLLKGPEYAAILRAGIPHAEFHILKGAGHATCWERPKAFNSVVLDFLAKQIVVDDL